MASKGLKCHQNWQCQSAANANNNSRHSVFVDGLCYVWNDLIPRICHSTKWDHALDTLTITQPSSHSNAPLYGKFIFVFLFFFGWSVSIQSIITPLQFRLTTDLQITRWGCYTNSATESHQHKCWLETDIPPSIWFHLNHWQRVLSLKAEFVYFITVLWSFVICFFYLPNLINPVDSCLCIPPSFVLGTKQTIFL